MYLLLKIRCNYSYFEAKNTTKVYGLKIFWLSKRVIRWRKYIRFLNKEVVIWNEMTAIENMMSIYLE